MVDPSRAQREEARALRDTLLADADRCVMCGLCLPHCPTFVWTGRETESPRGRVAIARQVALGVASEDFAQALESCLQCRSCEAVCPAEVPYGRLIEQARSLLPRRKAPNLALAFARWPRASAWLAGLAGVVARALGGVAQGRWWRWMMRARFPARAPAAKEAVTCFFRGCAARSFEAPAQARFIDVATRIGEPIRVVDEWACCGAIERHLGRAQAASDRAYTLGAAVARAAPKAIVALDSACIVGLRAALHSRVPVIEGCRWLLDRAERWKPTLVTRIERVGLFLPCSHRHALGDVAAVRGMLALLPGLEAVEVGTGLGCCGGAGPHLLADPARAEALAAPIVERIRGLQLDRLVTTNVGCALHLSERLLAAGIELPVTHPVACLCDRLPQLSSDVASLS
jgi:glycolate oxidase iron-sulfur subunit